jgi:hypothetical protein
MPNARSPRQSAPDFLLVLGLAACVAGLGATVASMAPSERPIILSGGGTGAAPRDWRARSPGAVALTHPAPAPLTRDIPTPNPLRVVARDPAIACPSTPSQLAERIRFDLVFEAAPRDSGEGDLRRFLAQTARSARRPKIVDPMGVPSVSALEAHLEARVDPGPVPGTRGTPVGMAPAVVTPGAITCPATRHSTSGAPQ